MKLTREIEYRIERVLYRQGKIVGGVYVGRGQEAISVGTGMVMRENDVVAPTHRDMGIFLIRGLSTRRIIAQYMGRKTGVTRGKDGNMQPQIEKVFDIANALPAQSIFTSTEEADNYLDSMQKRVLGEE